MSRSLFCGKGEMTRREFVKTAAVGTAGLALMNWPKAVAQANPKNPYWGKVVVARDDSATQGSKIKGRIIGPMLDEAVNALTDGRGWGVIFPIIKPGDKAAIKINTMAQVITNEEVLDALVIKLIGIGFKPGDITIFDGDASVSKIAGLEMPSIKEKGVRILVTGYTGGEEFDPRSDFLNDGTEVHLARIITESNHLINVPVLKDNIGGSGITFSLKNHVGSIDNPRAVHKGLAAFTGMKPGSIAAINNFKGIKEKTRLIVGDSIFGVYEGGPFGRPQFIYNGLIVGTDPVAVDHQARIILDEERAKHRLKPLVASHIEEAARLGIGASPNDVKVTALHRKKMG